MIGTAFAAIAIGISAVPTSGSGRRTSPTTMPSSEPTTKPPSASLNVYQPAGQSVWRSFQNARDDRRRLRQQELLDVERARSSPATAAIASTKTTQRGQPLAELAPCGRVAVSASAASSSGSRCSPRLRRSSRTCVTSSKKRGSSRVSTVRGYGRSIVDDAGDAARPRAHHDDARREEDRLGDRVRDEDDGRARASARSRAARGSAARVSSRRARRTARPSAAAPARTASARAIETRCCMPPESCHGWWSAKPVSSTSSSISSTRALRRARSQPSISSGRRDVLRDRAPVEEDGVLEDDPVVAVERAPACAGLPLTVTDPPSARSGRRSRAGASTCRSRTGRSARRTRPRWKLEVDVLRAR